MGDGVIDAECGDCLNSPCDCGRAYRAWHTDSIERLIGVLFGELSRRLRGGEREPEEWEKVRA